MKYFNKIFCSLIFLFLLIGALPRAFAQGTPVIQYDFTASGSINTQNTNATGTATPGSAVLSLAMNNAGTLTIQVTGTYTGALTVQVSLDGVTWVTVPTILNINTSAYSATIPSAANGVWQVGIEGMKFVQVTALAAVTGTAVVQTRASASTATVSLDSGTSTIGAVIGATANGVAPTTAPVLTAGITASTLPAAGVANGLVQTVVMTSDRQQAVHANGDPVNEWMATSGITALATNTSTALKAAGAAGVRNYVTDVHLVNNSATVATTVSILDGATVIWTTYLPATTAALQVIPVTQNFQTPLKGTAATAMNIQCGTTGSSVFYNVGGFQNN